MSQHLLQHPADARVHRPHLVLEALEETRVAAEQVAADLLFGLGPGQGFGPLDDLRWELLEEPGRWEIHLGDEVAVVVDADLAKQDALLGDIVLHDLAAQVLGPAVGRRAKHLGEVVFDEVVADFRMQIDLGHGRADSGLGRSPRSTPPLRQLHCEGPEAMS